MYIIRSEEDCTEIPTEIAVASALQGVEGEKEKKKEGEGREVGGDREDQLRERVGNGIQRLMGQVF